ncbi:MAG TPA: hypothetical protein VFS12_10990, partial [Terriglobia bacterium]|nr:hypothetical protein [Terriglobia bacterium]
VLSFFPGFPALRVWDHLGSLAAGQVHKMVKFVNSLSRLWGEGGQRPGEGSAANGDAALGGSMKGDVKNKLLPQRRQEIFLGIQPPAWHPRESPASEP